MTYSEVLRSFGYANHVPRDFGQARFPEWDDTPQPDFLGEAGLGTVLDTRWMGEEAGLSQFGMQLLQRIRRGLEEGMRRLRLLETERLRYSVFESLLERMPSALGKQSCPDEPFAGWLNLSS